MSKQMTWAELVAWAEGNGFGASIRRLTFGGYKWRLTGIGSVAVSESDYISALEAQAALCRAVSKLREAM